MWSVFYVALLLVVGIFCLLGGIDAEAGILDLGACAVALFLCGTITLTRNRISDGMAELPIKLRVALRAVAIVCVIAFVSILSAWMIDYVWLDSSGSIQLQFFAVTNFSPLPFHCLPLFLRPCISWVSEGEPLWRLSPCALWDLASPSISW